MAELALWIAIGAPAVVLVLRLMRIIQVGIVDLILLAPGTIAGLTAAYAQFSNDPGCGSETGGLCFGIALFALVFMTPAAMVLSPVALLKIGVTHFVRGL